MSPDLTFEPSLNCQQNLHRFTICNPVMNSALNSLISLPDDGLVILLVHKFSENIPLLGFLRLWSEKNQKLFFLQSILCSYSARLKRLVFHFNALANFECREFGSLIYRFLLLHTLRVFPRGIFLGLQLIFKILSVIDPIQFFQIRPIQQPYRVLAIADHSIIPGEVEVDLGQLAEATQIFGGGWIDGTCLPKVYPI